MEGVAVHKQLWITTMSQPGYKGQVHPSKFQLHSPYATIDLTLAPLPRQPALDAAYRPGLAVRRGIAVAPLASAKNGGQ